MLRVKLMLSVETETSKSPSLKGLTMGPSPESHIAAVSGTAGA
jgi:hypothetical protein